MASALNVKSPEAHRLAEELAAATGESLTAAVTGALRERLAAVRGRRVPDSLLADIAQIQRFVAALPVLDSRSPDEVIGYDEQGLPR